MSDYSASELSQRLEPIVVRLRNIEAQLAILSEKAGVPYVTVADVVPHEVTELARADEQLKAMALYRKLTGANGKQARDVISSL